MRRTTRPIERVRKSAEFAGRVAAIDDGVSDRPQALHRRIDIGGGRNALVYAVRLDHGVNDISSEWRRAI
jgi:hypothetical protein